MCAHVGPSCPHARHAHAHVDPPAVASSPARAIENPGETCSPSQSRRRTLSMSLASLTVRIAASSCRAWGQRPTWLGFAASRSARAPGLQSQAAPGTTRAVAARITEVALSKHLQIHITPREIITCQRIPPRQRRFRRQQRAASSRESAPCRTWSISITGQPWGGVWRRRHQAMRQSTGCCTARSRLTPTLVVPPICTHVRPLPPPTTPRPRSPSWCVSPAPCPVDLRPAP
jgi:hypothetical protein